MSVQRRTVTELQYRECDLMAVVRHLMAERITGQIILDLSQGVVCAVTSRVRTVCEAEQGNGYQKTLDNDSIGCATIPP